MRGKKYNAFKRFMLYLRAVTRVMRYQDIRHKRLLRENAEEARKWYDGLSRRERKRILANENCGEPIRGTTFYNQ